MGQYLCYNPVKISIHAPRVGSDGVAVSAWLRVANFNPRSPGGERRGVM